MCTWEWPHLVSLGQGKAWSLAVGVSSHPSSALLKQPQSRGTALEDPPSRAAPPPLVHHHHLLHIPGIHRVPTPQPGSCCLGQPRPPSSGPQPEPPLAPVSPFLHAHLHLGSTLAYETLLPAQAPSMAPCYSETMVKMLASPVRQLSTTQPCLLLLYPHDSYPHLTGLLHSSSGHPLVLKNV